MSPYQVILILEFFPARLATIESNVTQLLANMLTKPTVVYYLPIVSCNFVSIKLLLLLLLLLLTMGGKFETVLVHWINVYISVFVYTKLLKP